LCCLFLTLSELLTQKGIVMFANFLSAVIASLHDVSIKPIVIKANSGLVEGWIVQTMDGYVVEERVVEIEIGYREMVEAQLYSRYVGSCELSSREETYLTEEERLQEDRGTYHYTSDARKFWRRVTKEDAQGKPLAHPKVGSWKSVKVELEPRFQLATGVERPATWEEVGCLKGEQERNLFVRLDDWSL